MNESRLKNYVKSLDKKSLRELSYKLLMNCIEVEDVKYYKDTTHPYWPHSGEPIIDKFKDSSLTID